MAKYTTTKGQNNDTLLEIDGLQSICPFTPAITIPNNGGQGIQLIRMACTSTCPHASFNEDLWLMTCTGKELKFKLENKEDHKIESKVINLSE
jgi:hypothetical protein